MRKFRRKMLKWVEKCFSRGITRNNLDWFDIEFNATSRGGVIPTAKFEGAKSNFPLPSSIHPAAVLTLAHRHPCPSTSRWTVCSCSVQSLHPFFSRSMNRRLKQVSGSHKFLKKFPLRKLKSINSSCCRFLALTNSQVKLQFLSGMGLQALSRTCSTIINCLFTRKFHHMFMGCNQNVW